MPLSAKKLSESTVYAKSEDWLHQSSLLLEARPSTTRITTKYRRSTLCRRPVPNGDETKTPPAKVIGFLTLTTYDPVSGVCLKYRTTKAAEVGRLMAMLGGPLGQRMVGQAIKESRPTQRSDHGHVEMGEAAHEQDDEGTGEGSGTPAPASMPLSSAPPGSSGAKAKAKGKAKGKGKGKGKK